MNTFNFLLHVGSCEQYRCLVKGDTKEEIISQLLNALNIHEGDAETVVLEVVPGGGGYPGGTPHYEIEGCSVPRQVSLVPVKAGGSDLLRKIPEEWEVTKQFVHREANGKLVANSRRQT